MDGDKAKKCAFLVKYGQDKRLRLKRSKELLRCVCGVCPACMRRGYGETRARLAGYSSQSKSLLGWLRRAFALCPQLAGNAQTERWVQKDI